MKKIFKDFKTTKKGRGRLIFSFSVIAAFFVVISFRVAWITLIKGPEYAQKASKQQTYDEVIYAFRGNILDTERNPIALSATTNTIWIRPGVVKSNGKTDEDKISNAKEEARIIAEILGLDEDILYGNITGTKALFRIAKNVDSEKADKLREHKLAGLEIVEDSKRYYPLGAFASQIIGITSDDNVGISGLEKYYDNSLSGTNGRWITSTDLNNNILVFGKNKYYDAENGYSIVTTIDSNIQRLVEEKIAKYQQKFKAKRVTAIVMDPKTGEINAMAQSDEFDLNNPRGPKEGDEAYYNTLTEAEQVNYWYQLWRNFAICDVYEPGSTFKPLTAALALDYGVTNMNEWFYCSGYRTVEDWTIHCWNYPWWHGDQQLTDAICNSCNSVMIELVQRIGRSRYYDGLRTFSITEHTGIDYPGEASNLIYPEKETGPVELATMAFGQGIAVTPISLITAISSLANDGKLMQPHFVKEVLDAKGNVVEKIEPVVKNITVSAETAANVMTMLEKVVTSGGAGTAAISGYRVGGKTGTSYKAINGVYSDTQVYTSFIGVAPMEDPQYVVLVIFDEPDVGVASLTAAACEKEIMEGILLQKNIRPTYTQAQLAQMNKDKVKVPNIVGSTIDDAIGILSGQGLDYEISGNLEIGLHETTVSDQFPRSGTELTKGSKVTIYYK